MNNRATWDELPIEIKDRMLQCQVEQGNPRDENVFRNNILAGLDGGFAWLDTEEGISFWDLVLNNSNFQLFFERYPKDIKLEWVRTAETSDKYETITDTTGKYKIVIKPNQAEMRCVTEIAGMSIDTIYCDVYEFKLQTLASLLENR